MSWDVEGYCAWELSSFPEGLHKGHMLLVKSCSRLASCSVTAPAPEGRAIT